MPRWKKPLLLFDDPDQVLIMVDLWGGTPFNQANGLIDGHEDTWAIVAGLNLPMLIDAYASRMTMETAHEIAVQISGSGKDGVKIYPESLEPKKEEAAPVQAAAPQGAIPEGTVLGDGTHQVRTRPYRFQTAPWTGRYRMDQDDTAEPYHRCI